MDRLLDSCPVIRFLSCSLAILVLVCLAARCQAWQAPLASHAIVPGFERLQAEGTAEIDLVEGGRLLLGELGCLSCHAASAESADLPELVLRKQGPRLDDIGRRVRLEFLKAFVANPRQAKPGTTMPQLIHGFGEEERRQRVEALVHYLAPAGGLSELAPTRRAVTRGRELFHTVGCAACHDPRRSDSAPLKTSVPLPDLARKYSIPSLAQFLADPLQSRPAGRMPHLNLSDAEARDIASYLLADLHVEANVSFAYFEGDWDRLPDFQRLKPRDEGTCFGFDLNVAARTDSFAVRFEGMLRLPGEGEYTFHLGSDDGSRLIVAGQPVVINDGIHAMQFAMGKMRLAAGMHPIVVEYFERGGEERLQVDIEGPGMKRQSIDVLLTTDNGKRDADDGHRQAVDASVVEQGRELFRSAGCVACHQRRDLREKLPEPLGPPLASLQTDRGCLSSSPAAGIPNYRLSAMQRRALAAAVAWHRTVPRQDTRGDSRIIEYGLRALNCYACHSRSAQGGVESARNELFRSQQPEMGDEGRLPPPLNGVGAKLTKSWLQQVLTNGAKDRPYMFTRMPGFGEENAALLASALSRIDTEEPRQPFHTEIPVRHLKAAGRLMAGEKGFSCIKCHTFGKIQATGIQAISLTTMARRLNADWFYRYMLDPQRYRRGTRMPASWPNGQILLPDVLDGRVDTQIEALWIYLSDGELAAVPPGLESNRLELAAEHEPLIYRNFIEGAGARAIGVGYPEGLNLAFDANGMRLALLWHGAFIDASRHWTGRGQGFAPPLGDNVLRFDEGPPFAILDSAEEDWPARPARESGFRFLGYRLDERRRPIFRYEFGGVAIEDKPEPVAAPKFPPLRRVIQLTPHSATRNLWFRAAVAEQISHDGDGWFVIDGNWRMKIATKSEREPRTRKRGSRVELLVPVTFDGDRAEIVQSIVW